MPARLPRPAAVAAVASFPPLEAADPSPRQALEEEAVQPLPPEREAGAEPSPQPGAAVAPDEVGYVFTGDDENTVFHVLDGRVDAGALSEEDLAEDAGSRAAELVAVARTIDVPRHAVVAAAGLDPALQQAAVDALVALHESAGGRAAMADFDGTTRFDVLAPEDLAAVVALRAALDDDGA